MSMLPISTKSNTIEGLILSELQNGPLYTVTLIEKIRTKRPGTTKQAVYAILKNLLKQEVLVIHNKNVSFNFRWLKNLDNFVKMSESNYLTDQESSDNFLKLKDGEKIEYTFNDLNRTDAFWWQALYLLSEKSESIEPAFLYNPHEWFLVARNESELESIKEVGKRRRFLMTSGGKNIIDKYVSKYFDDDNSQYHTSEKPLFLRSNYYVNIVDDFLIEVWIDKKIANAIDVFYNEHKTVDVNSVKILKNIISAKGKIKLSISRNSKKASKLKQLLRKPFYIPALKT